MVDIPDNTTTTTGVTVGSTTTNTLEVVGDHDWFRINLVAGQAITVSLNGVTLEDPFLRILDQNGVELYFNDDSGADLELPDQLRGGIHGSLLHRRRCVQ